MKSDAWVCSMTCCVQLMTFSEKVLINSCSTWTISSKTSLLNKIPEHKASYQFPRHKDKSRTNHRLIFFFNIFYWNLKHIHKKEKHAYKQGKKINKKQKKTCICITLTHSRKGYLEKNPNTNSQLYIFIHLLILQLASTLINFFHFFKW